MPFHNGCIIASAVCFALAAFGLAIVVSLPLLGMCFLALSFYQKSP
jgi:hypothetical protein